MLEEIREHPPAIIYAGLRFFARMRHHKDAWAGFAFKDIYGHWPPEDTRMPPLDCRGTLLEEWCWARRKRERKEQREEPPEKFKPMHRHYRGRKKVDPDQSKLL
jgi:hypothetical protein